MCMCVYVCVSSVNICPAMCGLCKALIAVLNSHSVLVAPLKWVCVCVVLHKLNCANLSS